MWLKMGISFIFVLTSNLIGLDRKLVKRETRAFLGEVSQQVLHLPRVLIGESEVA